MGRKRLTSFVTLVVLVVLTQSGCALIALPFQVLGELIKIVAKLPKPPPGVF